MTRPSAEDAAPAATELAAAKRALRADLRRRRAERPDSSRRSDDGLRTTQLIEVLAAGGRPGTVAAYLSSGTEPDSLGIVDWLAAQRVEVLVPASTEGAWAQPAWAAYAGVDRLRMGPREILEPSTQRLSGESIERAEIVLCPGLAGTPRGERLGRGGGWYDRVLTLTGSGTTVVLLLNDDEVLESLPTGTLDRRVGAIVTPTRRLECTAVG